MDDRTKIRALISKSWLLVLCFILVTGISWIVLDALVSPVYLSTGIVELGYFNPRDFLPHPVVSTSGLTALIGDASFSQQVAKILGSEGMMDPAPVVGAAPLEEGLIRVEAREGRSEVARRATVVACSLVVDMSNQGYERERSLLEKQLALVRSRSALAESLIRVGHESSRADGQHMGSEAMRALAHLTEIQLKTETATEHVRQKKRTRILVTPGAAHADRPSTRALALVPGFIVTLLLGVALAANAGSSGGRPSETS